MWQPIETAPRDGTPILLFEAQDQYVSEGFWATPDYDDYPEGWRVRGSPRYKADPDYWAPMPSPPPQVIDCNGEACYRDRHGELWFAD